MWQTCWRGAALRLPQEVPQTQAVGSLPQIFRFFFFSVPESGAEQLFFLTSGLEVLRQAYLTTNETVSASVQGRKREFQHHQELGLLYVPYPRNASVLPGSDTVSCTSKQNHRKHKLIDLQLVLLSVQDELHLRVFNSHLDSDAKFCVTNNPLQRTSQARHTPAAAVSAVALCRILHQEHSQPSLPDMLTKIFYNIDTEFP